MSFPITRIIRDGKSILKELRRDGKGAILFTIAAGWFLSIGVRYIYPSLLPFFRTAFGLDLTISGLLLSSLWFAYALGQFPGGVLGDQIGEGNILVGSTALATVAVLTVALSVDIWMLFLGTVLFGFATALYGPTRFTIFTDIYADRAGTAVGLSHAAGSIGNTVLPPLAAMIATHATWRLGYGILIPAFIGITIALRMHVPGRTSSEQPTTGAGLRETIRRVLQNITANRIPVVVIVQVLIGFVSQGFLGFYPTYLIEIKGFSPQMAALLYSSYFLFGIVVQPLTGLSKDRFGSRVTLAILVGLFFAGLLSLHFAQTVPQILLLTLLLSHRNGTGVVTNTFVADALEDDIKGTGLGFLRTGWILIGATSPIIVGYFGDLGYLRLAFLALATLAGIATVLTVFIPSR